MRYGRRADPIYEDEVVTAIAWLEKNDHDAYQIRSCRKAIHILQRILDDREIRRLMKTANTSYTNARRLFYQEK